jgi:hypothetical protein
MTKSIEHRQPSDKSKRPINFDEPPSIGFVLQYLGHEITLVGKIKRLRKDGSPGWLLIWMRADGVAAASGLSSKGLSYPSWLAEVTGGRNG